ncbi:type VI secretion system tip protein TssI/VgrG [Erwinia sp. 9145]|uniref:type VI secretion system tip protein TssI/VgrG n=1 Tax=Erwinia sp. 9145 TaxID=1500895 RepID=UPI000558856D|nr:type VI secretion system tip protein TssI/VgrG [Erwinia sp. 9145]
MFDRITARLPVDGLLFRKLEGTEALSDAFVFTLKLLGHDARLDRHALLGQPVTVVIPLPGLLSEPRYLNGKITAVAANSEALNGTRYTVYTLTVEPDLWPLKRDKNQRIFQHRTVPEIVKTLLGEYGIKFEDRLTGSYRVWEYCVQYQESSFAFIRRLTALEGIYWFFRHSADSHTLVLADSAEQHEPFPGYETVAWHATPSGGTTREEGLSNWRPTDSVTPGLYSTDDYDFRKPNAWMLQARQNPASPLPGRIDFYDWPGHFVDHSHGEAYARIRQQAWQAEHRRITASATAVGLTPGHTFTLIRAPAFSDNGNYLILSATYLFEENSYASGDESSAKQNINITVIPADVTFRPSYNKPWPRTCGPQTAKVAGPHGKSIWTDKYGRIKVKFHWDRNATGDDTSSCWIRVSGPWAGQGFGGVQIPRVGDEVVVDFINGDPDRPIVTGRVYNEAYMPPWALPAAATQSGFMTRTKDSPRGSENILRFEDKAGAQQILIQAERDLDVTVKHNANHHIAAAHHHFVGGDAHRRVAGNHFLAVKGDTTQLTGGSKRDAAADMLVLGAGRTLRLECGESVLELNADGQINLTGRCFNFFATDEAYISTGSGALHLNDSDAKPGARAPGINYKTAFEQELETFFTVEQRGHSMRPETKANSKKNIETLQNKTPIHNDNFSKISSIVLRHEGGYANRLADKGGPTNRGIAWKTWLKYAKEDLGVSPTLANLKALTIEQAEIIYKKRYWNPSGFQYVNDPKLALMSYDWTITSGGAGRKIQHLLNNEFGANIKIDGFIGTETIQAMNSVKDPDKLTSRIAEIRKEYYWKLTESDPRNKENINGWLNRVDSCMKVKIK